MTALVSRAGCNGVVTAGLAPQAGVLYNSGTVMTERLRAVRDAVVRGAARVLDLGAVLDGYDRETPPLQRDANAIRSDWQRVGDDLRAAMSTVPIPPDHAQQ